MKKQFGRSMIEMLGVLAIIGVLSIGGIALYRRAVNNHQANTILDDVNRFAFVIVEKGNYPLGEDLPKGDFKESGIYTLTAHQALSAGQFSILVSNVPKGVCEPLVEKGHIEYKVGVVAAGGSVDDEIIYDTLNTDLCQEMNDVAFYFGDTSGVCNAPDESGYTPCTENSDCCGEYFCAFENATAEGKGNGTCRELKDYPAQTTTMSDGKTWTRSRVVMTYWSAQTWCTALGLKPATRTDIDCVLKETWGNCTSDTFKAIKEKWTIGAYWLEYFRKRDDGHLAFGFSGNSLDCRFCHLSDWWVALCH